MDIPCRKAWLEFDLVCFVADVDFQACVQSELNFAVFQRLTAEHIIVPPGTPMLDVHLGPVGSALEHIAQAIGAGNGADKPGRTLSGVASATSVRSQ